MSGLLLLFESYNASEFHFHGIMTFSEFYAALESFLGALGNSQQVATGPRVAVRVFGANSWATNLIA